MKKRRVEGSTFFYWALELQGEGGDEMLQLHNLEGIPDLGVLVVVEGVDVLPDGAHEEHGVLGENGEPVTNTVHIYLRKIQRR